jgi:hypothetical protein
VISRELQGCTDIDCKQSQVQETRQAEVRLRKLGPRGLGGAFQIGSKSTTMSSSTRLLQFAVPLVKTHGFTRKTLSLSVLSLQTPHAEPLSDTAVSSLWGQGDDARRTLITAWQDDARQQMKIIQSPTMRGVLRKRLELNEPVLSYLPEVGRSHQHPWYFNTLYIIAPGFRVTGFTYVWFTASRSSTRSKARRNCCRRGMLDYE